MPNKIYLDHSATTPVDGQVVKAMQAYWTENFGNPSSLHSFGQDAIKAVDGSRETIADFLGCQVSEVIFTSGATESNNIALQGIVRAYWESYKKDKDYTKPHVITTAFEHPAILETARFLEKHCGTEVTYLKPNKDGFIQVEDIKSAIKDNTILISIMYVNNEIGTIQPIQEIGQIIQEYRNTRIQEKNKTNKQSNNRTIEQYPLFHTDAVQALNYCNCNINDLKVGLLSLSGHKIYGPKGIGALYVKNKTPIKPIQFGGHHEYGIRPGTINAPLIVGLGKAVELIKHNQKTNQKIKKMRDKLWLGIQDKIKGTRLNGSFENRVPSNLNINFNKVEGESLLLSLDMEGIAVSTGSACSSGSLEPSHVLLSLGYQREQTHGSLRITLGKDNTEQEIDKLLDILPKTINRLRGIAPSN